MRGVRANRAMAAWPLLAYAQGPRCLASAPTRSAREIRCPRYALGARGIDGIETTLPNASKVAVYPVCDGAASPLGAVGLAAGVGFLMGLIVGFYSGFIYAALVDIDLMVGEWQ